jgi:arylsulfatase A-like enzyme
LPRPPAPAPRPALPADVSFVIVFIDTLRPDRLGAYGHPRPTSPNLDRIAGEGIVFERAYAASTFTTASLAGFATARPPGHAGFDILRRKADDLPAELPAVMEAFDAAGYKTAVVTDLAAQAPSAFRGTKMSRGLHRKPAEVVPAALKMLDQIGDQKFVLVVYFAGPHSPYRRAPGAPDFGDDLIDMYDSAIASTDALLGPLFDRLDQPGYRDRVVVTALSDHGEAFGEHGFNYHGQNVHDETVRIPMVMRVPGLPARRLGDAPVSHLDVTPTLLNLAGLPQLPGSLGHDLTAALTGGALDADRHVFVEHAYPGIGYQAAVIGRRHKLIYEADARSWMLHDLEADPGERRDVSAAAPEAFLELRRAMAAFRAGASR